MIAFFIARASKWLQFKRGEAEDVAVKLCETVWPKPMTGTAN